MRPIGKVLLSKGLLGRIKAISLSTIGILDELIRRRVGGQPYEYKEWYWLIVGIKQFALDLTFEVVGRKEIDLELVVKLIGESTTFTLYSFALKGLTTKDLLNTFKVTGYKEYQFTRQRDLTGKAMPYSLITKLFVSGIRQHIFEKENSMVASKLLKFAEQKKVSGNKQISIDNTLLVKGKRNIENILVALDMK